MARIQPSVLSIVVDLAKGINYVDCAQLQSAINRRLYRQGKMQFLASAELEVVTSRPSQTVDDEVETGGYDVNLVTIPDTWVTRNAWYKAFRLWKQMIKPVLEDAPSSKPKWEDFKVYFDATHAAAGTDANLKAQGLTGVVASGEWNDSTMVPPEQIQVTGSDPVTAVATVVDTFTLHMLGEDTGGPLPDANLDSGAIIQMYAETRAMEEQGPELFDDIDKSWGMMLTQRDMETSEKLVDTYIHENDFPPYDRDVYPGMTDSGLEGGIEQWGGLIGLFESTIKVPGFGIPLGLLKITAGEAETQTGVSGMATGDVRLRLNFIPGPDKGYLTSEVRQ